MNSIPNGNCYRLTHSPLGELGLVASEQGLVRLVFAPSKNCFVESSGEHLVIKQALYELSEYFAGRLVKFETPLALQGSRFQLAVWDALNHIPYRERRSYDWIARQVGNPKATRAVGRANSANPLPIFVPCHRVIRKDGSLGGYSAGLDIKRWLLKHEQGGRLVCSW